MRTEKERLYSKTKIIDSCLVWTGCVKHNGYGLIRRTNGKMAQTHRLSYELTYGNIPTKLQVCHTCDNPACINPNHLFLGTNKENANDRNTKQRQARGEKHGKSTLTEEDVKWIRSLNIFLVQREVAEILNVGLYAVKAVLAGKTWKHI